jgi:predicted ABC-type ATPase
VKDIVILGGSNGAGKTTAARIMLPEFFRLHEYLNADEIARKISPNNPDSAAFSVGRELLANMRRLIAIGESFAL